VADWIARLHLESNLIHKPSETNETKIVAKLNKEMTNQYRNGLSFLWTLAPVTGAPNTNLFFVIAATT